MLQAGIGASQPSTGTQGLTPMVTSGWAHLTAFSSDARQTTWCRQLSISFLDWFHSKWFFFLTSFFPFFTHPFSIPPPQTVQLSTLIWLKQGWDFGANDGDRRTCHSVLSNSVIAREKLHSFSRFEFNKLWSWIV